MKLPNGYGTVYKLTGKRRNPFVARKTIGWDNNGKQLYSTIGYYADRPTAIKALVDYNENPYDIDANTITFAEVYSKWSENKFKGISHSAINGYIAAYETSAPLHSMKFVEIKTMHLQNLIDTCGKGHGTLRKIRTLFSQMFKYAMQNDIVNKDYSDYVEIGKNKSSDFRKPFTTEEINTLFSLEKEIEFVDTILIMIFTGLRIGELLLIKSSDVDLENKTITGGIKTDAGKDRLIPINNKIFDLVKKRKEQGNEYLIVNFKNKKMKYANYYREKWAPIMEQLSMQHRPHDARHTFATLMSNAEANPTSIKKLIGHSSYITTEKIYTHKDVEELRKAIELI